MPPRLLLVVLALPLAGAACGGSKHAAVAGGDPLTTVKTAFKKTFAAGSESVNLKANAETSGQSLVLSGGGAFNTKSGSGTLRLHIDAGPLATSLDEVIVGSVVYLKSPLFAGQLPDGKTWVELDGAKLGRLAGVPGSLISGNPADQLKKLQYVRSAREIGNEHAGTRFRATLDMHALPAAFSALSSYDVWVGNDGFIHRLRVVTSKPQTSVTVDLSDFGSTVTASAPPRAEVYASTSGAIPGLGP
jgi:hypothetical protein